jgi:hypothetical protein
MFPHERSLVKNLASQPFALIGVNTDKDKDKVKEDNEKEAITWRSFIDGSTNGPISTAWHVEGFPTLYLLDHKGVIRFKWLGSPGERTIDTAILALLKEMQQEARIAAREAKKAEQTTKTTSKSGDPAKVDRIPDEKDKQDELAFTRLKFAKELANEGKTEKARERLQDLIKKFPKSPAAEDAKELLKKLR